METKSDFYCDLCKHDYKTKKQYNRHLKRLKHQENEKIAKNNKNDNFMNKNSFVDGINNLDKVKSLKSAHILSKITKSQNNIIDLSIDENDESDEIDDEDMNGNENVILNNELAKYYCKPCNKKYSFKQSYYEHLKTQKHKKNHEICLVEEEKKKSSVENLNKEVDLSIDENDKIDDEIDENDENDKINGEDIIINSELAKYYCKPCNKKFSHRQNYYRHLKNTKHKKNHEIWLIEEEERKKFAVENLIKEVEDLKKKNHLLEVFVDKKLEEVLETEDVQLPVDFLEYEFIDLAEKMITSNESATIYSLGLESWPSDFIWARNYVEKDLTTRNTFSIALSSFGDSEVHQKKTKNFTKEAKTAIGKWFALFDLLLPKVKVSLAIASQKDVFDRFILFLTCIYEPSTVKNWIKHMEFFYIHLIVKIKKKENLLLSATCKEATPYNHRFATLIKLGKEKRRGLDAKKKEQNNLRTLNLLLTRGQMILTKEVVGFTNWVYTQILYLTQEKIISENFFYFQCLLFSLLVIFCGGQRTEMFAQLNEMTFTYDSEKKQWGLNVQKVKNGNKEEQLWIDKKLSGLIAEWQNVLKEKKLTFGWWNSSFKSKMNSSQISEMLTISSFSYNPGLFLTVYSFRRLAADSAVSKEMQGAWAHFARTSVAIVNKHYATSSRYDSHELVKEALNQSFGTVNLLETIEKDFQSQAQGLEEEVPIREILYVCYLDYNQPLFLVLLKNNTLKFYNNPSFASKNVHLFRRFLFVKKGFRSLPISSFINEEKEKKKKENNNNNSKEEEEINLKILPPINYPNKLESEWILDDFVVLPDIQNENEENDGEIPIPPTPPPVYRFDEKILKVLFHNISGIDPMEIEQNKILAIKKSINQVNQEIVYHRVQDRKVWNYSFPIEMKEVLETKLDNGSEKYLVDFKPIWLTKSQMVFPQMVANFESFEKENKEKKQNKKRKNKKKPSSSIIIDSDSSSSIIENSPSKPKKNKNKKKPSSFEPSFIINESSVDSDSSSSNSIIKPKKKKSKKSLDSLAKKIDKKEKKKNKKINKETEIEGENEIELNITNSNIIPSFNIISSSSINNNNNSNSNNSNSNNIISFSSSSIIPFSLNNNNSNNIISSSLNNNNNSSLFVDVNLEIVLKEIKKNSQSEYFVKSKNENTFKWKRILPYKLFQEWEIQKSCAKKIETMDDTEWNLDCWVLNRKIENNILFYNLFDVNQGKDYWKKETEIENKLFVDNWERNHFDLTYFELKEIVGELNQQYKIKCENKYHHRTVVLNFLKIQIEKSFSNLIKK